MKLTEIDALRAYARMINTLDTSHIEPLLVDDFRYSSQWLIGEIASKQEFIDYIQPKLAAIRQSGGRAYAEIAIVQAWGHDECVVMAEGEMDNLIATVFAHVNGEKIRRIDMCAVPHPSETMRTGEYPSLRKFRYCVWRNRFEVMLLSVITMSCIMAGSEPSDA